AKTPRPDGPYLYSSLSAPLRLNFFFLAPWRLAVDYLSVPNPQSSQQAAILKTAPGKVQVVAERKNARQVSRQLWRGLSRFNQMTAGRFNYSRIVLSTRNESGRIVGGLILQSYWKETYIELLWLAERARGQGRGRELIQE